MALNGIGSYITTADQIDAHWTEVNQYRLANAQPELVLKGGFERADFVTQKDALEAAITGTEYLENGRELAAANRDAQKEMLRERMAQFRVAVGLHLKNTAYYVAIPTLPQLASAESKFIRPFDDMLDIWSRVNADTGIADFTPPLTLRGGYTLATFTTDLEDTRTRFKDVIDAENELTIGRRRRDALLAPMRERMLQYRGFIELEYGPGHPLYESLPDLYPQPGSTPDPIIATGQWIEIPGYAVISWNASTNPNLDHYAIRMTPGATYDANNATVIGNQPSGSTSHQTTAGLLEPASTASYRVFVVLTTGNESGSNTVTITRTM